MPRLQYAYQRASEFSNWSKSRNTNRAADQRMMRNRSNCRYSDLLDIRDNAVIRNPHMRPRLHRGRKP